MHRIAEAEACGVMGGAKVTVLSREALSSAEAEAAVTLELRSSGLDENGDELSLGELNLLVGTSLYHMNIHAYEKHTFHCNPHIHWGLASDAHAVCLEQRR